MLRYLLPALLLLSASVSSVSASSNLKPQFKGAAAGVHGALVISPDDDISNNYYHGQDVGGGGGIQADIFFTLGSTLKGKFAWTPSFSVWGKHDDSHNGGYWYNGTYYDYTDARYSRFEIDLVDFKYVFPVPFALKPYIGLGGPSLIIHHFEADYPAAWNPAWDDYYWEHTDANAGFNFFAGIDIAAFEKLYPFLEVHVKATGEQTFRLKAGFNVVFK